MASLGVTPAPASLRIARAFAYLPITLLALPTCLAYSRIATRSGAPREPLPGLRGEP